MYLCLFAGNDPSFSLPRGKDGTGEEEASGVRFSGREKALRRRKGGRDKAPVKSKYVLPHISEV